MDNTNEAPTIRQVGIYLPDDLWEQTKHAARVASVERGEDISASRVVEEALRKHFGGAR